MKKRFCRGILSLVLITSISISGQYNPLKIGDTMPPEIWTTPMKVINHPQNKNTISLAEYKDKLILLDFWATWCESCLKNFPKMHELQKRFDGKIQIIPVTGESSAILNKFFSTSNGKKYTNIASIKEDKIFHELFPHRGVPFIVWIKEGRVINTTDAQQVKEKTVSEILNEEKSSLQTVIQVDRSRPFMLSENYDLERQTELMSYKFLSKGRIRSSAAGTIFRRKNDTVYGRLFSNMALMFIYQGISYELFSQKGENFNDKRVINLVKNPEELIFNPAIEKEIQDKRYYTFDYIDTPINAGYLYSNMLATLNQTLPYTAIIEEKKLKCWIITKKKNTDSLAQYDKKNQESEPDTTMKSIISIANADDRFTTLPVLDETGILGNTGIDIKTIKDAAELIKIFNKHHLEIKEEERNLMMLVIRDK